MTTPTKQHPTPLDALLSRRAAIDARIEAVKSKLTAKSRKDDTRLKILVGAAFLADAEKHPDIKATVAMTLDRAIRNPKDRAFLVAMGKLTRHENTAGKH